MTLLSTELSGVCGWAANAPSIQEGSQVLAGMLGRNPGARVPPEDVIWSGACGVAIRTGSGQISMARAGDVIAAAEGRMQWHSSELASIALGETPAAALLEAYRGHGTECLQHIGGSFAVAVVDARSGSGLLAVDRMGIGTMCYANLVEELIFGSNAEIVAAHPKVGRQVSSQAIFNYLYCHVVPSPGTIYGRVEKLLPGQCIIFSNGRMEKRFYWHLAYRDESSETFGALNDRFRHLLRETARRAIGSEAHVGAFLSGGTDSSTVTGLLTELQGKPARTYSIGFAAKGFDEMEYARITARHFATSAHEYYVTPQDVVYAIPIIARSYDEPFGNESAVPTYYCARMARADGIDVMLAGDGGDELFGGNARYARQRMFEAYGVLPAVLRRGLIEPLAEAGAGRIAPLRKLRSYIEQASVPLPDRLEAYNFLHRSPLAEIFDPSFLSKVDTEQPLMLQREVYERASSRSPINRMMHLDLKLTLADNDLRKVSRMCQVAGVEARYPLLDEALVEFSGRLPPSLKVRGLTLRYFFKQALKDFLPPQTIAKTKHGFGMPFGLWLREHAALAEVTRNSLEAFARRGIVKPTYIATLVHQHESTHATYFGVMIWVIMMLEHWLAGRGL